MEKNNINKWVKDVENSISGFKRAKPDPILFNKIKEELFSPKHKLISLVNLRLISVAAIFLLLLNIFSLYHISNSNLSEKNKDMVMMQNSGYQDLVSDFKLYN